MLLKGITLLLALAGAVSADNEPRWGGSHASSTRPGPPGPSKSSTPPPPAGRLIHWNSSKFCLGVLDDKVEEGAKVDICDCIDKPSERWEIQKGYTEVRLAGTNLCLDAGAHPDNGVPLKLWTCYPGIGAQSWFFTDDDQIKLVGRGLCVDVVDGNAHSSALTQTWACQAGSPNQRWTTWGRGKRRL